MAHPHLIVAIRWAAACWLAASAVPVTTTGAESQGGKPAEAATKPAAATKPPALQAAPQKPSGPAPAEAMSGLSFDGLRADQKTLAVSILNENGCDCGCGMKIGVCRRDDSNCGRSLALGNQVIDLVKKGKSRAEIIKIALTPPSKFVEFPLSPGVAPSVGPANAKVTILHYLDYQ